MCTWEGVRCILGGVFGGQSVTDLGAEGRGGVGRVSQVWGTHPKAALQLLSLMCALRIAGLHDRERRLPAGGEDVAGRVAALAAAVHV